MTYTPQTWNNNDPTTPLSAARLTNIENGIVAAATSASPTLTGIPVAPTAAVDTNTTQVATTAFVVGQGYAKLASPTFSGTVNMGGNVAMGTNRVTGLGDPTAAQDAATRNWADLNSAYAIDVLGFKAANGDPGMTSAAVTNTGGTLYVTRLVAPAAFTLANVVYPNNTLASGLTAGAATASVSGTQVTPNDGSSFTLTTSSVSGYPASGMVTIGTNTLAYSAWTTTSMTVIANSYPRNVSLTNATIITSMTNGIAVFNASGNPIGITVDLTANTNFTTTGAKVVALPQSTSIAAAAVLYVALLAVGTTPPKPAAYSSTQSAFNLASTGALSGANLRWGTNGTGLTSMPATITPANTVVTSSNSHFFGLA